MKHLFLALFLACPEAWAGGESVTLPHGGLTLVGRLYTPAGKGPFPAIVLLHGCNGMWNRTGEPNRNYEAWAEHFQKRGYQALILDSFGPRGEREICTQGVRNIHPGRERAGDARAALQWLAMRPDVLRDRIHLLGWSNGGTTVIHTIESSGKVGDTSFRSAVAFYPGCKELVGRRYAASIPLLIQAGAADDWTPARHCEALVVESATRGVKIEIDTYEGAHHAFDGVEGKVRFRPDVRNPSSTSGRGAHIGPNPAAREKSRVRTTEFIEAIR